MTYISPPRNDDILDLLAPFIVALVIFVSLVVTALVISTLRRNESAPLPISQKPRAPAPYVPSPAFYPPPDTKSAFAAFM